MGDVLSDCSLSASRDRLLELSVVVTEHERKPVQLPRQHNTVSACKFLHVTHKLGLVCRKHRLRMGYGCQAVENFARYLLCGRACEDDPRACFQCLQLIRKLVVLAVEHNRCIVSVIGDICLGEYSNQLPHFFDLCVVIRTHFVCNSFLF